MISQVQITSVFLKYFSPTERDLIYDDTRRASECFKMMDILEMASLYDEIINAKDLISRELVQQEKSIDTKWMNILGELQTNSYKSTNLLVLVSKNPNYPMAKYLCWGVI